MNALKTQSLFQVWKLRFLLVIFLKRIKTKKSGGHPFARGGPPLPTSGVQPIGGRDPPPPHFLGRCRGGLCIRYVTLMEGGRGRPISPSSEGVATVTRGGQPPADLFLFFLFFCFFYVLRTLLSVLIFKNIFSLPNKFSSINPTDNTFSNVALIKYTSQFSFFKNSFNQNSFKNFTKHAHNFFT